MCQNTRSRCPSSALGGCSGLEGQSSVPAECSPPRGTLVSQELTPESFTQWLFPNATKCA